MINSNKFLDNIYNLELRKTISKFIDGLVSMEKNRKNYYISDFLSPLEFTYALKVVESTNFDFEIIFDGEEYDRKLILVKDYEHIDKENFLELISFKDKNFEHRNILGSILNLGISREKIGDIVKISGRWYVYCLKPIGDFLFSHLDRISRYKVKVELIDEIMIFENFREFEVLDVKITSMRLDCLVKELAKVSRENAKNLIRSQSVKLNHEECKDSDKKVSPGDVISIRGKGKFKIMSHNGFSRKDKNIIELKRYI